MASLTQTAVAARRIIRYGIFGIIFLIIARILFNFGAVAYKKMFPPKPPPPTVSFGKLPNIPFPQKDRPEKLPLVLETPEGTFPKFSTQIKVFFMPKLSSNLLSADNAKTKARLLGFPVGPFEKTQTVYRFSNKTAPSTLEIDIVTWAFSISYDLKADPTPLDKRAPTPEEATTIVNSFLSAASLLATDLTGPTNHEFLKSDQGKLVTALSLSDAKLIKVSLYRKEYDKLPTVTSNPNQSNVWFIISGAAESGKQVISGEYHYYPVDETKTATYPTRTAQEAWDELTNGGGFISDFGENYGVNEIKIRRVYLAYFDPDVWTEFFQPVYVFEGDRGFKAYAPAIASSYYGK